MSDDIAISVRDVSKRYLLYDRPQDRLKQSLFWRFGKNYAREFWALRGVSFEVRRGEMVGIIGRNGAGKSTLLQIIAGTLQPTEGEVQVNGRVGALLELGSGFNPEFTGRENVYLNGAILGFSREEMDERFDEIAAFADIGEFMDQPMKLYSSGMFVRLAFAVQACVEPDILIVDEALAVGDIFFQQKCSTRMEKLRANGTTLLIVSHNMNTIQTLCRQSILLDKGEMIYSGESVNAVLRYQALQAGATRTVIDSYHLESSIDGHPRDTVEFLSKCQWVNDTPTAKSETERAKILGVRFQNSQAKDTLSFKMGERMRVQLLIESFSDNVRPSVTVGVHNRFNHLVFCGGAYTKGVVPPLLGMHEQVFCNFEFELGLQAGDYTMEFVVGTQEGHKPNTGTPFHKTPRIPISILWDYNRDRAPFLGEFNMPCDVEYYRE